MPKESPDPTPYLAYLDKEMTLMGILSGFSIAVPSFILSTIFAKPVGLGFSNAEILWVGAGLTYTICAALLFYLQRSLLAYYYGQLSLAVVLESANGNSIDDLLGYADAWVTWLYYQMGFIALTIAFLSFGIAAVDKMGSGKISFSTSVWGVVAFFSVAVLLSGGRYLVVRLNPDSDNPYMALLEKKPATAG